MCGGKARKVAGKGISSPGDFRHPQYSRWRNILSACYMEKHRGYPSKGALGFTVCERWLTFSNFAQDVEEMRKFFESEGFSTKTFGIFPGKKEFTPENCYFDESAIPRYRRTIVSMFKGKVYIFRSVREAARGIGAYHSTVTKCLEGGLEHVNGARFFETRRDYSMLTCKTLPYVSYNRMSGYVKVLWGDIDDGYNLQRKGEKRGEVIKYVAHDESLVGYAVRIPYNVPIGKIARVQNFSVWRGSDAGGDSVGVLASSNSVGAEKVPCFGGEAHMLDGKVVGADVHSTYMEPISGW